MVAADRRHQLLVGGLAARASTTTRRRSSTTSRTPRPPPRPPASPPVLRGLSNWVNYAYLGNAPNWPAGYDGAFEPGLVVVGRPARGGRRDRPGQLPAARGARRSWLSAVLGVVCLTIGAQRRPWAARSRRASRTCSTARFALLRNVSKADPHAAAAALPRGRRRVRARPGPARSARPTQHEDPARRRGGGAGARRRSAGRRDEPAHARAGPRSPTTGRRRPTTSTRHRGAARLDRPRLRLRPPDLGLDHGRAVPGGRRRRRGCRARRCRSPRPRRSGSSPPSSSSSRPGPARPTWAWPWAGWASGTSSYATTSTRRPPTRPRPTWSRSPWPGPAACSAWRRSAPSTSGRRSRSTG